MSSSNNADDWGLLSVADIIDSVVSTDDHEAEGSTDVPFAASDEASVPSFLLEAPLAENLQRSLLSGLKKRLYAHSTRIERVFEVRFRKVKLSLSSSKKIRDRLSEAIVSMGASLPAQEEHTSLLSTIALLGAVTDCDEKGAYTSVLLDSVAHVNWDIASPQSCLELFRIVEAHASEDELSDELRVAVARTKLGLALRSGCLSLLLKCLVAPSALLTLDPAVFPPKSSSQCVRVSTATMSDFLVKTLVLPAQFRPKDSLQCSAHGRTLLLLGDTHVARYEALGTMGTRLIQRSVQQLPGQRGDVVLHLNEAVALCIRALGRDEHFWHFSVCREGLDGESHGRLTLRTTGLPLAEVRFHFCVTGTDTLCCLVSSHPPQRTRGCLYVGETSVEALLGTASTITLAPLFRNPSLNAASRRRTAFHFTKSVSVAVGRVTLKDRFHPFCIEMWVFPRSVAKDQIFLSIGDKSVEEVLLGLEPVGDGVRWRGGARTPRLGPSFAMYNSAGKLSVLERWWHVALNFNGAAWELWLDHELVSRQPALVSPNAIANAKCVVGKSFIGLAAEVRVWQHTRTAAELARDARRPLLGNEDGLCAYFPLDEGYGNVIMDYAPHHEHALLPYGEPYWCAVGSFPVLGDSLDSRQVLDFVPQAWIEEADEVFFAASRESYTIAGVRSDHTLCVFDYARDRRCLVAQRSVELPVSWCVKGVSADPARKSLCCCAVAVPLSGAAAAATTSAAPQVFLWEMWAYAGHTEAAPHVPYDTSWQCGKAVLERSAAHAQRILWSAQYLTDQSTWASVVPPFVLDPDDAVLTLLLGVAQQADSAQTSQGDRDLVQQACTLLQVNLLARLYSSPLDFALRVGGCYDSVEQLLRAAVEGEETDRSVVTTPTSHLRESIIRFALRCTCLDAPSSSALLRCCCQCFLTEGGRLLFLEAQSGKLRAPAAETVYCCLLTLYSSLHTCCDLLSSQPACQLSSLFSALYMEAMYQVDRSLRVKSVDGLLRTSHCLEVLAEVLLSGCGMDGDAARLETLQCVYSTALLRCCEKMVDAVSTALRQLPEAEATFLKCVQLSPIGALLASFAVSLPLLPTSALAACSVSLQKCRESLLVLIDRFPGEEAKRWASRLCVALTYSLAQLGCTLLNPLPSSQDAVPVAAAAAAASTAQGGQQTAAASPRPPYLSVLRNGQRRLNTERDALIKNLQGGVGVLSRVFEELQMKDVSALRVVRDEQLRETERQVMAACCALLLPTQALREATPESLLPAFQLVLKLRPWCLSKRQESKEYVTKMRERAVFLALFEPIAEVGDDEVGTGQAGATSSSASSRTRASSASNSHAAQLTQRQKWRRLFKSWKAMRQLKALMSSREEAADLNVGAEIIACFQSEMSTSEMESAVAWRSKKAQYRLVGLQLLWQLTEEARHSALLARVLHPVIARTLCGWHYADGVDGCSVEQLTRLQSAFFLLLEAAVKAYEEVGKQAQPWVLLLAALFSCPFRRTDLRKLRTTSASAEVMRRLWTADGSPELLYERVNGSLPRALRATKLSPIGCASTMTVGAAGLTLRSSGGRGSCVAPCTWTKSVRKEAASYYYEVHVVDLYQGGYVSVGLGPADYSLSQMPGWNPDSFAYDGLEGAVYNNRNARVIGSTFGMGDVVGCGWDREAGDIFWTRNGKSVHSVKALVTSEQLSPLIGMKGKGCVLVNFGARPFVYQTWPVKGAGASSRVVSPTELASGARHLGPRLELEVSWDGWDAFRLLSMRAAKVIGEAASQVAFIAPTSMPELAETVGRCLDALVGALASSAEVSLSQLPLPARYVTTLLGHLTLLCKFLRGVPGDVIAIHTSRVAALLAKMATRWLLTTSRVALFSAEESEAVTALLMAWYYTMYLTPPTVVLVPAPNGNPRKVDATSSTTPSSRAARAAPANAETAWPSPPSLPNFLQVLLQLASCIITTDDARMSASETRHVVESSANLSVVTSCDTAHWLALSLLQHLNNDRDERSHHAWQTELQAWLQHTLKAGPQIPEGDQGKGSYDKTNTRDILLGLAILGGIPRLAVPGDTVMAHLSTHTIAPVLLLHPSWSEEMCEVLEVHAGDASKAAVKASTTAQPAMATHVIKRLPLRFVHATLGGDEPPTDTFPIKGDKAHLELAEAVAHLAQVWFVTVTPATRSSEDVCLVAQLSCVLVRCAERHVVSVSPQLIDSLSVLTGMANDVASNMDQVRLELVLSLWGLLQYRQRRGLLRNSLSAMRTDRGIGVGSDEREQLGSRGNAGCSLVRVGDSVASPTAPSSMRLRTFAALDSLRHHLLGPVPDVPDMTYEEEDDEGSDPEDDGDSEFGTRSPYPLHGMDDLDEEDGADDEDAGPSRLATIALAQTESRLSASSTPDALFLPTEREMFDTIHFNGGCVRLVAGAAVGLSFTVDLALRMTNIERHQILFAQMLRGGSAATALEMVARITRGNLEFGWFPCFPGGEAELDPADPATICSFALSETDLNTWIRVTFVQSGTTLSLFRGGLLLDSRPMKTGGGSLLQEELRLGGIPQQLGSSAFIGDIKNFRVYELALRPAMVEQLRRLNSSLSMFLESHLALLLKTTRTGVENAAKAAASVVLDVWTEGDVGYLDESEEAAARHIQAREACAQELDFGTESEETDLRVLSEPLPSQQSVLWHKKRSQSREQLLSICASCYHQLAAFYSAHILAHAVCCVAKSSHGLSESDQHTMQVLKDDACVARLADWAVSTSGKDMATLLDEMWLSLCRVSSDRTEDAAKVKVMWEMGNALLAELLRIAQRPPHARIFESAHPQRPFASNVYEVQVAGQRSYAVFVDERSVASWRLVTVSADRTLGAMLSEFCSTALSSFEVCLPQFFLTVRSAAESSNWGHRIAVVHDYQPQLRAMRIFRSALSVFLTLDSPASSAVAYVWSVECLMALRTVAQRNTSKTRLLAFTCLNHLLLFSQRFRTTPPPLSLPLLLHDVRRMALRHYRRRLPTQRVLGRFIQMSMESYVMQRDAAQCWQAARTAQAPECSPPSMVSGAYDRATAEGAPLPTDASAEESAATVDFLRHRQEQMQLYRQRDTAADRVSIQKVRNPQSLSLEWSGDGVCILRSDGTGGSVVAGVPLTAGRWYYELRIGGTGDLSVGVLPIPSSVFADQETPLPLTSAAMQGRDPVTFNGCTGAFHCAEQQQPPLQQRPLSTPLWFSRDYLGIVIDIPAQRCTILVNGVQAVSFTFGPEAAPSEGAAAASPSPSSTIPSIYNSGEDMGPSNGAGARHEGGDSSHSSHHPSHRSVERSSASVAYYPYVSMGQADSVSLNFGAAYFEHEVPSGCLPLDPANLSLGTMFPYNQMRSLQDLAAHLLTGGRYPLPPFYYEEADPFAGSTERVGPAHVSVQASANVQVNMEDVKNTGLDFETVTGDCAVGAGAWYFEVTLRTQGLMQIGWMQKGEAPHGNGHGVGDSSTSWSVDLFRRVMWHRGVPEPVNTPRRWAAGDVVGCAVDMAHGELSFFLNGRPITGASALESRSPLTETCTFRGIPQGLYYVPAVSLRSGGAVSFNFGSSPFKYKPEGFSPLGVPDSWNERMDTFYNNASAASTQQRMAAMQEAWRVLRSVHPAMGASATAAVAVDRAPFAPRTPATAPTPAARSWSMDTFEKNLLPYRLVVHAIDNFSSDVTKSFTKNAEDELAHYLATFAYPDNSGGVSAAAVAERAWDMFKVLKAVSKVVHALLPFLSLNTTHPTLMTLLFLSLRTLLFRAVRRKLVESVLTVSSVRSEQYRICINRAKAHAERQSVKSSVFGQTFALLGSQSSRIFQTHQRFWSTVFLGEGAEDAGGPFREHLSEMCRELMSGRLPFFVPTANHVHNTGSHREAYVPAASARSAYDLEAFAFIGKLMGGALRSEDPLDLFLPPLVWRYLCAYPITEAEVEQVDVICVQCVREFRVLSATHAAAAVADADESGGTETELFEDVFGEEFFVTQLSDHSTKELIEGGAQTRVTLARSSEYAEALLQARLHEFDLQLHKMREGLLSVVPEVAVLLLTPEELELRVCGQADYTPEELRKGASYEGLTSEDRRVQLLWKALEEATPLQRRLFLRFVSGRDRMPVKLRILPLTTQADADTVLPRAATCFFAIEVPDYSTLEVMKRKLYYSIENCADMDTDFNARVVDEDEGPQLSVALDDGQQDIIPPNSENE
ncbi:putative ubiquitin-protein ligase [Leishmania infantum JPCM5]|uniref:Ubiquitin-protein_ligase_-_putative n=2 Tax=Leishmania infantum TaxID=5671 RepID=A0A6L0XUH0_LEIIN|nr:putative ubiquitin-protein ligase [Leishmania infantum JPCM5]CAC9553150.1 ubiquitin-protein_ligase_-_putative [Leishmania infantum]CAM72464.2 putative ubiquitin-protein ligase [Leishmania infantum JPCM5]SUZ47048.1 ubiquitin-protein_ligase_-_putative [Leishmania infantum]|eukprot:XP_001469357.2 putative ubiquitin-protein ligase [Leishmania infantum JPCM5]